MLAILAYLNTHDNYRLLALGMELPEEIFVDMHKFEAPGETWCK